MTLRLAGAYGLLTQSAKFCFMAGPASVPQQSKLTIAGSGRYSPRPAMPHGSPLLYCVDL
jgi:hypothetical protein